MPEILRVRVIMTQEVMVEANNLVDAIGIATTAFDKDADFPRDGYGKKVWGHITSGPKTTSVKVDLDK